MNLTHATVGAPDDGVRYFLILHLELRGNIDDSIDGVDLGAPLPLAEDVYQDGKCSFDLQCPQHVCAVLPGFLF